MVAMLGLELPLPIVVTLEIILVAAIAGIMMSLVGVLFPKHPPKTGLSRRWSMKRLAIRIGEIVAVAQLFILTIAGVACGTAIEKALANSPLLNSQNTFGYQITGSEIGGAIGLLLSAILLTFVFLLAEIETNTRHSAALFEKMYAQTDETKMPS